MNIYVLPETPPTLAIETDGNQVLLSWPVSATGYILESTPSLTPAAWTAVFAAPVAADITQTVTWNLSNTNQFFRLRLP